MICQKEPDWDYTEDASTPESSVGGDFELCVGEHYHGSL